MLVKIQRARPLALYAETKYSYCEDACYENIDENCIASV